MPAPRRRAALAGLLLLPLLALAGCESAERLFGPPRGLDLPEIGGAPAQGGFARGGASGPLGGGGAPQGFTRLGSGTPSGAAPPAPPGAAPGGPFTLNFVEVDVAEVARVILGEMLRVNYVIDPRVRGPVTLEAMAGLPRQALIPSLTAALRTQGAGLVETAAGYEVVPIADARRAGSPPGRGTTGVLPVVPRNASAADLGRALAPLLNEEVQATVDEGRNLLVLSGDQRQLANLAQLIGTLDTDVMGGRSFGLYPLRNASAGAVVDELRSVFSGVGGIRFVPVQRQNSVLVVSNQPLALQRAAQWVRDLDRAGGRDETQVYVYQVEYGRAVDIARVLSRLFGGGGGEAGGERGMVAERAVAPGLAASRVVSGGPGLGGGGLGGGGLGGGGSGGGIAAQPLGAPGGAAADPAGQPGAPQGGEDRPGAGDPGAGQGAIATRIVADGNSNTVVVQTTPLEWQRIEAALRRLDQVPLQVLIEATIAEVTLNDSLRFGLQAAFRSGNFAVNFNPGGRSGPGTGSGIFASPAGGTTGGGGGDTLQGLLARVVSGTDARVLLDALSSITTVNVISSPQLMVLSNQTATLQVGDQVPIATQSAVPVENIGGRVVNSIQLRDTGVILRVTPRVNSSGLIGMDVEQEVSDVVPTDTSRIDSPTIRQRRIRSTVAVQSGETVALGGLIRRGTNRTRSGIPGLRDVPVIGQVFGSTDAADSRTELLVLITPRIVRNSEEARSLTAELRSRLTGFDAPGAAPARSRRLPPPPPRERGL